MLETVTPYNAVVKYYKSSLVFMIVDQHTEKPTDTISTKWKCLCAIHNNVSSHTKAG